MGLRGILELAAPYNQPWSVETLQVTVLMHSPNTCLILIPADQTQDQAALLLSSPKMAGAASHLCSWLSFSATSASLPKPHSWALLTLRSPFYCRVIREAQAAMPVFFPHRSPHLWWQVAPPGGKKSSFPLQNPSRPPDQGLLMGLSS